MTLMLKQKVVIQGDAMWVHIRDRIHIAHRQRVERTLSTCVDSPTNRSSRRLTARLSEVVRHPRWRRPRACIAELGAWNNGKGIELEMWVGCEGRFSLAVGYITLFWPEFEVLEDYIVRKGSSAQAIRDWERQPGGSRAMLERTFNHIHLVDLHYRGCPDVTPDKLVALGTALKEIYEAKLKWQFPDRPCSVQLYIPEDPASLDEYELTFCQTANENVDA